MAVNGCQHSDSDEPHTLEKFRATGPLSGQFSLGGTDECHLRGKGLVTINVVEQGDKKYLTGFFEYYGVTSRMGGRHGNEEGFEEDFWAFEE